MLPLSSKSRTALAGYLFISPWLIGFVLFTAGPLLLSLWYSLTNLTVFGGGEWIGLENYRSAAGRRARGSRPAEHAVLHRAVCAAGECVRVGHCRIVERRRTRAEHFPHDLFLTFFDGRGRGRGIMALFVRDELWSGQRGL